MKASIKKYFSVLIISLLACPKTFSQVSVSTVVEKKNFLIEKGTGHVCGSCPSIEQKCDSVIDTHPGRGMMIEYHFGPDAYPQGPPLEWDFTTPYGDTIYEPTMLNWPFYLNMMVNRRDQGIPYGSTFIFGVNDNQVQREADTVVNQNADVNIKLSSSFDIATRLVTINVDAYYTSNSSTTLNFLQVALTEDSIIGMQYDGTFNANFVHMNVFRDNINGFAGDTIWTTTAGTFVSRTYTYTIPEFYKNIACNPANCNLTVYIAEESAASGQQSFTGKVMNAVRGKVGTDVVSSIQSNEINSALSVYPNPSNGFFRITNTSGTNEHFIISDILGKVVYQGICKNELTEVDLRNLSSGIYYAKFYSDKSSKSMKIVLSN